ncbi:MAG: hypothetical protein K8J31_14710, partial [Anaerolineae bacterium]|nr:hypothetical protein [Anaerolineae bacterium]
MAADRYRLKYEFWLEPGKPEHDSVADRIELLKSDRQFSSVIRDGIMIISELRQGRVALLLHLFPWIKEEIQKQSSPQESVSENNNLQREIAELKRLIYEQKTLSQEFSISEKGNPQTLASWSKNRLVGNDEDDLILPLK